MEFSIKQTNHVRFQHRICMHMGESASKIMHGPCSSYHWTSPQSTRTNLLFISISIRSRHKETPAAGLLAYTKLFSTLHHTALVAQHSRPQPFLATHALPRPIQDIHLHSPPLSILSAKSTKKGGSFANLIIFPAHVGLVRPFYMPLAGGKRDLNKKVGEKGLRLGKVGYIWLFDSAVAVRKGRMMRELARIGKICVIVVPFPEERGQPLTWELYVVILYPWSMAHGNVHSPLLSPKRDEL